MHKTLSVASSATSAALPVTAQPICDVSAPWSKTAVVSTRVGAAPVVDIKQSRYSKERARMVTLINALSASGASLELDVPRIAVIGEQSSKLFSALD
mgnify:FL=1